MKHGVDILNPDTREFSYMKHPFLKNTALLKIFQRHFTTPSSAYFIMYYNTDSVHFASTFYCIKPDAQNVFGTLRKPIEKRLTDLRIIDEVTLGDSMF